MWDVAFLSCVGCYYGVFCAMVCRTGYQEDWCYAPREACFRGGSKLIHQCRVKYHALTVGARRGGAAPVPPQAVRPREFPAQEGEHAQLQTGPILQHRMGVAYQPIATHELFQPSDAPAEREAFDVAFEPMETSLDCLYT